METFFKLVLKLHFVSLNKFTYSAFMVVQVHLLKSRHCVESARIRSYSGPYFPAFRLNTERYAVKQLYRNLSGI